MLKIKVFQYSCIAMLMLFVLSVLQGCSTTKSPVLLDGIHGKYYDGYFADDLSFFDRSQVQHERVDEVIDFSDSAESWDLEDLETLADLESFSVIWEGRLRVSQAATYTLYLASDDASYLFLDAAALDPSINNATIDNGGEHAEVERDITLALEVGDIPIVVVYGEQSGNNSVQLSWSSEALGLEKESIPNLKTPAND